MPPRAIVWRHGEVHIFCGALRPTAALR
jgi:hypothetical protein